MKIKYLGTAAAEGMPALFCECDVCKKARETLGKNLRSRTQALINDDLLIDYPPDAFYHFQLFKIDQSKIRNLIITHVHEDHFYPLDFEYFLTGYSHPNKCLPFTIYGSKDLKGSLEHIINNERNQGFVYKEILPYTEYKIGNYIVTPLRANHGTENPYLYIISDGEKTMFFCHDTGPLKDEVINYLKEHKIHFDFMSLDCNAGAQDTYNVGHLCVNRNRELIVMFKELGIIDEKTKVVYNHFSHNGLRVLYDELVEETKNDGVIISYDGLEVEF